MLKKLKEKMLDNLLKENPFKFFHKKIHEGFENILEHIANELEFGIRDIAYSGDSLFEKNCENIYLAVQELDKIIDKIKIKKS